MTAQRPQYPAEPAEQAECNGQSWARTSKIKKSWGSRSSYFYVRLVCLFSVAFGGRVKEGEGEGEAEKFLGLWLILLTWWYQLCYIGSKSRNKKKPVEYIMTITTHLCTNSTLFWYCNTTTLAFPLTDIICPLNFLLVNYSTVGCTLCVLCIYRYYYMYIVTAVQNG